jgi:hypothetical protein
MGYASFNKLPEGISFAGDRHTSRVTFLKDITYIDDDGIRHTEQEVFDVIFSTITRARKLIVLDLFLYNNFQGAQKEESRGLSEELTQLLIKQRKSFPALQIILITDPINTVYGGTTSEQFDDLQEQGIQVVLTDLDKLRDSNPIYSFFWRLLVRPFRFSPGGWLSSPFGEHKVPLRSYLKLLNFKANHRKSIIADEGDSWTGIIATGNPHDASSAHRNVGVKFNGLAVGDLFISELAALSLSGAPLPETEVDPTNVESDVVVKVITEKQIKITVIDEIDSMKQGENIDLILFYLGDREVIKALKEAAARGVEIRLILDPNKDAFGLKKIGIPNRPVAFDLMRTDLMGTGIRIRWAHTHGEQCHSKLMLCTGSSGSALILGSANFTRRNLDDFNLETDVVITGPNSATVFMDSHNLFERTWNNEPGRTYSIDYDHYRDAGRLRYWLYRLMELTGISTF